jgi:hypothetical protein
MAIPLRRTLLAVAVVLGLPAALPAQTSGRDAEYLVLGRKYYDWFISAEADSLLAHMDSAGRQGAGGVAGVNQAVADFLARSGVEQELLEEKVNRRRGHPQYWRESRYTTFTNEPLVFRFVFDEQGRIIGVGIGPKSGTPAPD